MIAGVTGVKTISPSVHTTMLAAYQPSEWPSAPKPKPTPTSSVPTAITTWRGAACSCDTDSGWSSTISTPLIASR